MPAPQASMMQNFARLQFSSNGLKVPDGWQQPQGDHLGKHYTDCCPVGERNVAPDAGTLFQPASTNKVHVDTQKMLNDKFGKYIDGICSAICSAWSQWQSLASMSGVVINAITGMGGVVAGPPWTPLILSSGPKGGPMEAKYTQTIATVLGTGWLSYTGSIKLAGMPMYPAFAAVPSPVAPPSPNTPVPLISCIQVTASISASALKGQMMGQHGDPKAMYSKELFDAVTSAFEKCFMTWQASTQLTNIMGTGPVPTFAPPYVPVGPVVGGVGTMTPGGFV
jgi:hypothetical protein